MVTFPLWFNIFLIWGVLSLICETYLLLTRAKHIDKIKRLPDETKANKIEANYRTIKILKLFFWAAPVYLILTPFLFYLYTPAELFHYFIMIIIAYILGIECFLICKRIVVEFGHNN